MVTVKCQQCDKTFKAQRSSAKFCSSNCRVKFNTPSSKKKKVKKTIKSVTISSTKEKPQIKVTAEEGVVLSKSPVCKKEVCMEVSPILSVDISHIREAAAYFEKTGMTIPDLIEFHKKNRLKVVDVKESQKKEESVRYDRFKLKNKVSQ